MGVLLKFLTEDRLIVDLCTRYWQMDGEGQYVHRTSDLSLPDGLARNRLAAFVSEHCQAYDPDHACPKCGKPFLFPSRTEYQQRKVWRLSQACDECQRGEAARREAERQAAEQTKRSQIQEHYGSFQHGPQVFWDELCFKEAVALLALLRLAASEDLSIVNPVEQADGLFAPTSSMSFELLCLLHNNRRIRVHPASSLNAFTDDVGTFYPFHVAWWPPIGDGSDTSQLVSELESVLRIGPWPEEWHDQSLLFWREIALHECLQYLQVCMAEHSFEFSPGDKTKQVLNSVLQDYSPAQCYVFVWRAVKDAAAYLVSSRVPKQQAANSVVGRIQRMAERAKSECWEIKPYGRDRSAPESEVGHVLYRVALKLGEAGINYVPSPILHGYFDASAADDSERNEYED